MSELFDDTITPDPADDNRDYLSELVGDGKKYKDPQALAKAYQHAVKHISIVEREAAEKEAELGKRLTYEDLLNKIKEPTSSVTPPGDHERTSEVDVTSKVDDIVNQKLAAYEKKSLAKRNVETVRGELQKVWGNTYPTRLKEKAAELEVSEDFLANIAETNPKAFLKLVVPERQPAADITPPRSALRPNSGQTEEYKPYSHYKQMMLSKDPSTRAEYWSSKTQKLIHELHDKYGDDFLNR